MKKWAVISVTLLSVGLIAAGTTGLQSKLIVRSSDAVPTCATSTGAGYICAEDGIESEGVLNVAGASTLTGAVTIAGAATFNGGLDVASPGLALETIRFCGNGSADGTAHFMGPVLLDDTEADLAFGGAGCDALDNATEATADAPWHTSFAFKPVAMVCVGRCTGASAADDAYTYQLRDDTADVSGVTCTASAFGGDDDPQQCAVRLTSPSTVAAGSAIAIDMTGTDDACNDAGDDFECLLYVTF